MVNIEIDNIVFTLVLKFGISIKILILVLLLGWYFRMFGLN